MLICIEHKKKLYNLGAWFLFGRALIKANVKVTYHYVLQVKRRRM